MIHERAGKLVGTDKRMVFILRQPLPHIQTVSLPLTSLFELNFEVQHSGGMISAKVLPVRFLF